MFNIEGVREYIAKKNYHFIGEIRYRPTDEVILLYVPQEKIIEKAKAELTSRLQLESIRKNISDFFSKNTELIITQSEGHFELEAGFYQILNRKYDDRIVALYLSFSGENRVNIWLEVKDLSEEFEKDIQEYLHRALLEANINLDAISWVTSETELPTFASLLRELKLSQPIDLGKLFAQLSENYPSISNKWLNGKLDQLRKKGYLRRERNGCYVLTAMAIASVPAGAKYTSSDIGRALALGRKKW